MDFNKEELKEFLDSDTKLTFREFKCEKSKKELNDLLDSLIENQKNISLGSKIYITIMFLLIIYVIFKGVTI